MFPDKKRVLHIFSGRVDLSALPGDTVDVNPKLQPTYVDDAQTLELVPLGNYDLILADPPYSVEDAERYQTTMIKRNSVMRALQRISPGAHVVWLDQVLPMYRKDMFRIEAVIGMVKSRITIPRGDCVRQIIPSAWTDDSNVKLARRDGV